MMEEDPKTYLCSVFFLRDFDEGNNETQVDFYSPLKKNMISFKVDKKVERVENKHAKTITNKKLVPQPLPENIKMDIDEMKSTVLDEMHNRDMTYEIEKVLAFLNMTDGTPVWNCTVFLKGLGLIQAHIEDKSASVLFMEKKSLFDLIKFSGGAPGMPGMMGAPEKPAGGPVGGVTILPPQTIPSEAETKPKTQKAPEPVKKTRPSDVELKKKDAKSK
jgi:hypothetical protein